MYHGTEIKRGKRIVQNQKMEPSISTERKQHWLGDGIYLYREFSYAFRWIVLMYKERQMLDCIENELLRYYSVLKVEVDCPDERIFRLDNPEHFMAFKRVEQNYRQNSVFSEKLRRLDCTDGFIINIMFKNLQYGDSYDMVEATFPIHDFVCGLSEQTRLKTVVEYQACVKNDVIITQIIDISDTINCKASYKIYKDIEEFKQKKLPDVTKINKYSSRGKGGSYGKWKKN